MEKLIFNKRKQKILQSEFRYNPIYILSTIFLVLAIFFLFFLEKESFLSIQGFVTSKDVDQILIDTKGSQLVKIHKKNEEYVNKNDLLLTIKDSKGVLSQLLAKHEGIFQFPEHLVEGMYLKDEDYFNVISTESVTIKAFVSPNDLNLIKEKDEAIFQVSRSDRKTNQNIDVFVSSIDKVPTEIDNMIVYGIECNLDNETLTIGTSGVLRIKTGKTNYFRYLIDNLFVE